MPRQQSGYSRRNVLKKSAVISSGLLVGGLGATGTAAAGIGDGRVLDFHLNNLHMNKDNGNKVWNHVHDASPAKNHGVNHGAEVVKDGAVGNAFEFDGATDYIDVPVTDDFEGLTDFTCAMWVQPHSLPTDDWVYLLRHGDGGNWFGSGFTGYLLVLDNRNDQTAVRGSITYANDANHSTGFDISELPLNEWSHLAFTRRGATAELYLNGGSPKDTDAEHEHPTESYDNLTVGGDPQTDRVIDGFLDEVRIYNRALSGEEIQELADRDDD